MTPGLSAQAAPSFQDLCDLEISGSLAYSNSHFELDMAPFVYIHGSSIILFTVFTCLFVYMLHSEFIEVKTTFSVPSTEPIIQEMFYKV